MSNMLREKIQVIEQDIQELTQRVNKIDQLQQNINDVSQQIDQLKDDVKNTPPQTIVQQVIQEKQIQEEDVDESELQQIHSMINKLNLQLQQTDRQMNLKDEEHDSKLSLLWNKVGKNQLQGGYKNQTDLINALYIQLESQINKINIIQNKLGTSDMNRLTFSDSINELRDLINSYQEQLYSISQQISTLDEIAPLRKLAKKLSQDMNFETFKQEVKQLILVQMQNSYDISDQNMSYGIIDNKIFIEKHSDNFDIRFVYNRDQFENEFQQYYDYQPFIQKTYKIQDVDWEFIKNNNIIIGGTKQNQPIFINTSDKQVIISDQQFHSGIFSGKILFKNCTLKSITINSDEQIEFKQCMISNCRINCQDVNILASNIISTKIVSQTNISINTYQQEQYYEARYIRSLDAQCSGKIVIQSNETQYGLSINDSKFHTQNKGVITFIGSRFFIKNSQFYVVNKDGSVAEGNIQYNFTTKACNMNMKSCFLKAQNIEFLTSYTRGKFPLILHDSNLICKKYTINADMESNMVYQL